MMSEFTVTEKAMRPASSRRQCFYCQQPIGERHRDDCVLVRKKVRVRMIVDYEIQVPHHWTGDNVEFHRNAGTWCADNAFDELEKLSEENGCLCAVAEYKYLGDTTDAYLDED